VELVEMLVKQRLEVRVLAVLSPTVTVVAVVDELIMQPVHLLVMVVTVFLMVRTVDGKMLMEALVTQPELVVQAELVIRAVMDLRA
jgi:hypothetical protein